MSFDFCILFYVDVVLFLAQTQFELLAPLISESDYHWTQQYVGLIYVVGGIELIVIFGLIYFFGHRYPVQDSYLLFISLFLNLAAINLIMFETYPQSIIQREYFFCATCLFVFASIPLNMVASKSLFTKILDAESQGLVQGVYSSLSRIALIAGPLLGSVAYIHRSIFCLVMSVSFVFGIIGLFFALPSIKRRQENMQMKKGIQN